MRTGLVARSIIAGGLLLAPLTAFAQDDATTDQAPAPESAPAATEPATEPLPDDLFRDLEQLDSPGRGSANGGGTSRRIELLDRDELAASGFEFGQDSDAADTSTALMLAVSAGSVVHGIGHLHLGDSRTGLFLLGMEGVGAVLMGSAAGYYALTGGETAAAAFFAPALQLGAAAFVFSYLLDVVGTLQSDQRLDRNTHDSRGIGFRARYGLFNAVGFPLRHLIDASLLADIGGLYASAATTHDVALDAASYRGRAGVRPVRGRTDLTFLSVEAGGEFFEYQADGEFARISADGRIGGSLQMGEWFSQLDQVALQGEIGFGYRWYQLAPTGSSTFELAVARPYIPFAAGASMNVSERLSVTGGYATSDSSWVPPLHRLLGIPYIAFVYRSSEYGDVSLRAEIGDGFGLWLGGSFWLLR